MKKHSIITALAAVLVGFIVALAPSASAEPTNWLRQPDIGPLDYWYDGNGNGYECVDGTFYTVQRAKFRSPGRDRTLRLETTVWRDGEPSTTSRKVRLYAGQRTVVRVLYTTAKRYKVIPYVGGQSYRAIVAGNNTASGTNC